MIGVANGVGQAVGGWINDQAAQAEQARQAAASLKIQKEAAKAAEERQKFENKKKVLLGSLRAPGPCFCPKGMPELGASGQCTCRVSASKLVPAGPPAQGSCFCAKGIPELGDSGQCVCRESPPQKAPPSQVAKDGGRARESFEDYKKRVGHLRDVMKKQHELTRDDPSNKANEQWCKAHIPLKLGSDAAQWENRCDVH
jgi:hypothetical protein